MPVLRIFGIALIVLLSAKICPGAGKLERAERLSDGEILELKEVRTKAHQQIDEARRSIAEVENKIAVNHKIKSEHWMEWSRYYMIDGDYILTYIENYMIYTPPY